LVAGKHRYIRAGATVDCVVTRITDKDVVAGITVNCVIAGATRDIVGIGSAFKDVISEVTRKNIRTVGARDFDPHIANNRDCIRRTRSGQNHSVLSRVQRYTDICIIEPECLDTRYRIRVACLSIRDG